MKKPNTCIIRARGQGREVKIAVTEEIVNYGEGTNVLCKVCRDRKIFLSCPTKVSALDGAGYLTLKCPSPACGGTERYAENELEIR